VQTDCLILKDLYLCSNFVLIVKLSLQQLDRSIVVNFGGLHVPVFGRLVFSSRLTEEAAQSDSHEAKEYDGSSDYPRDAFSRQSIVVDDSMVHRVNTQSHAYCRVVVGGSEVAQEGVPEDDRSLRSIVRVRILVNSYHALNSISRVSNCISLSWDLVLILAKEEIEGEEEMFKLTALLVNRQAPYAHIGDSGVTLNAVDLVHL